jgi:sporulation protein YlmC with PRC-barrel domain
MSDEIDLGLGLLDHQLVDSEGRRCGNVDDLALEGGAGEVPRVVAILVGPRAWRGRSGWIGRVAAWAGGGTWVRVPWEDVAAVGAQVELKGTARDYGLGRGDDRVRRWIEWIPGANR